ncbi:S8 family serine peptidase, partial [Streptomyces violaceoruber]
MTAPLSRHRRALAIPAGLAVAASLAFLPGTPAAATPAAEAAPSTAADATSLSYVVNVASGHRPSATVRRAIAKAGGTIVTSYDRIGVIVVHSANPDFAKTVRKVRGVQSAGATRTAPLPSATTTDTGAPQVLGGEDLAAAKAASAKAEGQDPLESLQWDLPAIKADKAHEKSLGSKKVTVAVIDTGVDDTHPDIAPNFDRQASVNCVAGKP